MMKKIKSVTNSRLKLDILSSDDVQRIHAATLEIIEKTGVRFPSKNALNIWEKHGASVDHETMVVKAPPGLIEDAIKLCPSEYVLAARDHSQELPMDGNHVFVGTDGCGVQILDLHTNELRRTRLAGCG